MLGDLGKLIVAQSPINRQIWSHWKEDSAAKPPKVFSPQMTRRTDTIPSRLFVLLSASVTSKNSPKVHKKLPQKDSSSKMKDFDTFTKIA